MRTLLVLDFDGVICDSVDECFVASWEAYQRQQGASSVPAAPAGRAEAFARLRPFVRTGADFRVILEIAEHGRWVGDQAAFDAVAAAIAPSILAEFRRRFYEARERLIAEERPRWLSLNRVYPHAREALRLLAGAPLRILSTKRSPYILAILEANGLALRAADVRYLPAGPKMPVVRALLAETGLDQAIFVDDQIDYLVGAADPLVDARLASWGYVQPTWLKSGVKVIDPPGLIALARTLAA